jgi:hypothetical protein
VSPAPATKAPASEVKTSKPAGKAKPAAKTAVKPVSTAVKKAAVKSATGKKKPAAPKTGVPKAKVKKK